MNRIIQNWKLLLTVTSSQRLTTLCNVVITRNTVRLAMGHLDPDGVSRRTRKRFIRRTYRCKVGVLPKHYPSKTFNVNVITTLSFYLQIESLDSGFFL